MGRENRSSPPSDGAVPRRIVEHPPQQEERPGFRMRFRKLLEFLHQLGLLRLALEKLLIAEVGFPVIRRPGQEIAEEADRLLWAFLLPRKLRPFEENLQLTAAGGGGRDEEDQREGDH